MRKLALLLIISLTGWAQDTT
ncbi:MAG: hypothetical protein RLZZ402_1231, partial [Bacteroidota bacterium]